MPFTTSYKHGDIVLVSVPFTDFTSSLLEAGASPAEGGMDVHMTTLWNVDPDWPNRWNTPVHLRTPGSARRLWLDRNRSQVSNIRKCQCAPEKAVY